MIPARLLKSFASSVLADYLPAVHDALSRSTRHASTYVQDGVVMHDFSKRSLSKGEQIAFGILIPVLVILSGVFAGLTLGYMSLDETQLHVLSTSGTAKQREYAKKIMPIRKNGHLLLVTLLLANMIVNETLPVISDPVLGGGVQSVVVSTVLIVIFSEIIPQSVCTRHGLLIGAKMAGLTQILIYAFAIVAWPVAKFLEFILGPHHGIIYRRGELKELIALHSSSNPAGVGGDLRKDTVTIIGATLDIQDKTVRHAMTPIDRVFMLHIDSKLDYDTLRRISATGHSRIPVFEEVEVNLPMEVAIAAHEMGSGDNTLSKEDVSSMRKNADGTIRSKVKKIIGILLVKQCVLLDPEDAVPVRRMRLNKVPFVPQNEPLLGILDRFQEGRSHMAIVSRISYEKAKSVKKAVHKNLTKRLLGALGGDSSSDTSDESETDEDDGNTAVDSEKRDKSVGEDGEEGEESVTAVNEGKSERRTRKKKRRHFRRHSSNKEEDLEKGDRKAEEEREKEKEKIRKSALEQTMPADAVLSKKNAMEYLESQAIDPAIMPLGIITLEDILEELIGEEIYDEFDAEGGGAYQEVFLPPGSHPHQTREKRNKQLERKNSAPELHSNIDKMTVPVPNKASNVPIVSPSPPTAPNQRLGMSIAMPRPIAIPNLKSFGFLRSRSAPPTPRDAIKPLVPAGSSSATPPRAPTPVRASSDHSVTLNPTREPSDTPSQHPTAPQINIETDPRALGKIAESPSTGGSPTSEEPADGTDVTVQKDQEHAPEIPTPPALPVSPQARTSSPSTPIAVLGFPNMLMFPGAVGSKPSTPRSGSPVPPLEAVLVERKRRGLQGTGATSSAVAGVSLAPGMAPPAGERAIGTLPTASSSSSVGAERSEAQRGRTRGGFKSSPLSPLGADESGVIAEEIRKQKAKEKEEREKEERRKAEGDSTGADDQRH